MSVKPCVTVGVYEGAWVVKYKDQILMRGTKRQALFHAAKVALTENVAVLIEPGAQLVPEKSGEEETSSTTSEESKEEEDAQQISDNSAKSSDFSSALSA